jgi:threonine dehydrogenase-like Zn-dependent dehydrogenase
MLIDVDIGGGGGLSGALTIPASTVLALPPNIPLDIGALVEPLSVAWHAISAAPLSPSDTVLVLGGGPIGLAVVQCLAAKGVKKVIVSEVAESRRKFAKEFGASIVLDPRSDDVVEETRKISGGVGVDVVFDCAGVAARYVVPLSLRPLLTCWVQSKNSMQCCESARKCCECRNLGKRSSLPTKYARVQRGEIHSCPWLPKTRLDSSSETFERR